MKTGVSLYPDLMEWDEISKKVNEVKEKGIDIIFTSIQLDNLNFSGLNNNWDNFLKFFALCKKLNIEVSVDVSSESIHKIGVTNISKLSSVKELGISTIRIDGGYSHKDLAKFTTNKENIKIEINASMTRDIKSLLELIKKEGNLKNLLACHNFFPREFTGLGWETFDKYTKIIKSYGVKVGAFVTTSSSKSKLCTTSKEVPTIELHRGIDLKYQIHDFKARDIDYILISEDTYTNKELKTLTLEAKSNVINIYVNNLNQNFTLPSETFLIRVDCPEKVIRLEKRIGSIEVFNNNREIPPFSLMIDNKLNGRYSGEIQMTLAKMPAREYINLIGLIAKEQHSLLLSGFILDKEIKFVNNEKK